MGMGATRAFVKAHALVTAALIFAGLAAFAHAEGGRDLRFFPRDVKDSDLRCEMNVMRRSLGVKSCSHCHRTDPRDMRASTENKETTRHMLAMVALVNSALSTREPGTTGLLPSKVDCYTCHRGEEMPDALPPKPEDDRVFQEAIKDEKYRKAVAAGEKLVALLNSQFFSDEGSTKASCWMCHRGKVQFSARFRGDPYADFK